MNDHVVIIAEAGVNHNGSLDLAKKLIDAAAEAGADYVKFQSFKADKLVSRTAKKADYQKKNINDGDSSQFEMLKKLELNEDMHIELISYCKKKEIEFLSTGFDEESIDMLDLLGVSLFKIPSGEITNKPYLQHIARKGKPIIISTGMATLGEIEDALKVILDEGIDRSQITVLHCNTEYPTPMKDVNLKAMLTIRDAFKVDVGYSDHTLGIEVLVAAVAMGAKVIEKHFTLDKNMKGPDHKASLEPDELKAMVRAIRNIEEAIGSNGIKQPSASELPNRSIARKSIHIKDDLKAGTIIQMKHLIMKRPGDGISPMQIDGVLERKTSKDMEADYKLEWNDIV